MKLNSPHSILSSKPTDSFIFTKHSQTESKLLKKSFSHSNSIIPKTTSQEIQISLSLKPTNNSTQKQTTTSQPKLLYTNQPYQNNLEQYQLLCINNALNTIQHDSPQNKLTTCFSPVENLMKSIKRNIFISSTKPINKKELQHQLVSPTLMKNPYVSEEVKNKYTSLLLETIAQPNTTNNNIKTYSKPISGNNCSQNENIINKKQALYNLLTDNQNEVQCGSCGEINQKLREFSASKRKPLPQNKIEGAKMEFDKLLGNNMNVVCTNCNEGKNYTNHKPRVKRFTPFTKPLTSRYTMKDNLKKRFNNNNKPNKTNDFDEILGNIEKYKLKNESNCQLNNNPLHRKSTSFRKV